MVSYRQRKGGGTRVTCVFEHPSQVTHHHQRNHLLFPPVYLPPTFSSSEGAHGKTSWCVAVATAAAAAVASLLTSADASASATAATAPLASLTGRVPPSSTSPSTSNLALATLLGAGDDDADDMSSAVDAVEPRGETSGVFPRKKSPPNAGARPPLLAGSKPPPPPPLRWSFAGGLVGIWNSGRSGLACGWEDMSAPECGAGGSMTDAVVIRRLFLLDGNTRELAETCSMLTELAARRSLAVMR